MVARTRKHQKVERGSQSVVGPNVDPHSPHPSRVRPHPPADWLAGVERGVLFSAPEHALRNEAAVDQLSHPEQEILLEHLARKLGARPPITEGSLYLTLHST